MPYSPMSKLFYMDQSVERFEHAEQLARTRLEAESTFRTGIQTEFGELFLAVPRELSLLNEQILRYERVITQRMRDLPPVARWATIRGLVVDEVVSTNELEGVYSTRRQINELLQSDSRLANDPVNYKRFRELANLYLNLSDAPHEKPQTPRDIRALYDQMMRGEPLEANELPDGVLFRKGEVEIIGHGGRVVHRGLHPEAQIIDAVKRMLEIVNSNEIPATYSAVLGHFVFEFAHPFYDGNGRTGRYLLALYLSDPLSTLTSLSLSRVIAENRESYYRSFREAEHPLNHGELTFFVMNILENVRLAQGQLDDGLSKKREMLEGVSERLDRFSFSHELWSKETEIVFMLVQLDLFAVFPEATQRELSKYIKLSVQQTRVHTKKLEDKGLIVAVSRKPLKFTLSDDAARELGLRE